MESLSTVALFAGIGGIEEGLRRAGHQCIYLNEIDEAAGHVLKRRFSDAEHSGDIAEVTGIPRCDIVTAGFPCQDLSMAGGKRGVTGARSSLVRHLFRLLSARKRGKPEFILIENVAYMLKLDGGSAMKYLTEQLEELGYRWAYRTVDPRGFGLPQRRHRVLLLAARSMDPRAILLEPEYGRIAVDDRRQAPLSERLYGFYWTEGRRGIGWAESSVPPIKGGSTIGIPSPPAVWNPKTGEIGTIHVDDAERLQGFRAGWTRPIAEVGIRDSFRWRLIGNAVCTVVSQWVGGRLTTSSDFSRQSRELSASEKWPNAGWGENGRRYVVDASLWPERTKYRHLDRFLIRPLKPLSRRAATGYLSRLEGSSCRVDEDFRSAVAALTK